ncbi:MAG: ferrous iron transport protein B, partial [Elusimicrobia bacterium]|nr:ferrous iron transport protein B [Elusimicrobiota bacterium]
FFENTIFKGYINPVFMKLFEKYIHIAFINELFIGEYGIITMALTYAFAIVLPIVTVFFIFFGLLEDSGYLPRLSALSDRLFSKIGLNGRAILPMVLGLGCGTMAVLTSRILDTKKERLLVTLLLALCIPCSAQLGVILGLLGSISFTGFIIWFLSILSSFVLVGFVASKIVKGEKSRFIQELPPIRIPKISNILVKTFARIKWYLKEAVPLFIAGTLFLFFLSKSGLLGFLNKLMNPIVVDLLNLPIETSSAFIVGFLRRDYGTAGLYMLYKKGMMTNQQVVVSLIVVTLFMPCIAQFLVTIKERGIKAAAGIMLFVTTYAILFGSMVNLLLGYLVSYKIISL